MKRAVWTPQAESELEDILYFISVEGGRPLIARQIGQEIRDAVDEQAAKGRIGHRHPAAPEGWLYLKHKRWLIFYLPHDQGIEILRVIDAVRDLPAQLSQDR